jgi:hypothetical protein
MFRSLLRTFQYRIGNTSLNKLLLKSNQKIEPNFILQTNKQYFPGPLTYFNGTHTVLVGVSSFVVDNCGAQGVVDGFARVTYQMDWIRSNSDNYVKQCSARNINSGSCVNTF